MYHLPSVWFRTLKDAQLTSDGCNKHSSVTALHQLDLLKRHTFLFFCTWGKMLVEDLCRSSQEQRHDKVLKLIMVNNLYLNLDLGLCYCNQASSLNMHNMKMVSKMKQSHHLVIWQMLLWVDFRLLNLWMKAVYASKQRCAKCQLHWR